MALTASRRAVFIDKDGTLVHDVPYNVDPDRIVLTERACEGLKLLQDQGFTLHVITNQPGIAKGFFDIVALEKVEARLREMLKEGGVHLGGFYYCPHSFDGVIPDISIHCDCRKPRSGMLLQAAGDHDIDLSRSWMVGDILNDVEAGHRAGCRTVLIDNGNETEWEMSPARMPDFMVPNLYHAACKILAAERMPPHRRANNRMRDTSGVTSS